VGTKYTVSRDRTDPNGAGNHRKNLMLSLEMSLRCLRTDYIDIYWVHIWDELTPIEETMRALDDAVRAGKVLYVGISDTPAWVASRANTLAEWRGWTPFAGLQVPYSLLQRDVERELLPVAEAYGMTLAAWSPLAGGILSGKFTGHSSSKDGTRVDPDTISDHDRAVAITVQEVAAELGASPAQVSIAWTMARSPAVCPIIGARRLEQLVDNMAALECGLPAEAMEKLEGAAGHIRGFPYDFIRDTESWVFGEAAHAERPRL
jgi:aryl-alcohol dehydrogenase-like predicted oxidoreductase